MNFEFQKNNLLEELLSFYPPSLFHFLDGHLNPDFGCISTKIIDFIKSYQNETKITNITNDIMFYTDESFKINNNDDKISFKFENKIINFNITNNDINLEINIENIKKIIDNKYNIFTIDNDSHATAIIFFTKDNNLYMLSCNSGMGINIHTKYDDKYSPYFGYLLVENYNTTNEKYIESIKKVCGILFIQQFYKYLENADKFIIKTDYNEYNLCILGKSALLIKKIFGENKFFDEDIFTFEYNSDKKSTKFKTINSLYPLIENSTGIVNAHMFNFIKPKGKYYIFFADLCKSFFIDKTIDLKLITNITNFNIPIEDFKSDKISIDDDIITKNILHVFNDNVYINKQESGSCTWFSVYWSILLYYVIDNDVETYKKIIITLNEYCYNKIQYYFNEKSYKKIINSCCNYISYPVTLYLSLAKKLSDLKIIDKKIFYKYQDDIYSIFDYYKENQEKYKSKIIDKDAYISISQKKKEEDNYIFTNKNNNILQINNIKDIDPLILNDILSFRIHLQSYNENKDLSLLISNVFVFFYSKDIDIQIYTSNDNIIFILLWELYKTLNGTNFFKNEKISINIKDEIAKLHSLYKDYDIIDKEHTLENLLNKFNIITMNNIHKKEDNLHFIKDYYNYVIYLNEIYREYDFCNNNTFTYVSYYDNNEEFVKICYFFEKFRLLLQILYFFNKLIKGNFHYPLFANDYTEICKYVLNNIINKFTSVNIKKHIIDQKSKLSVFNYHLIYFKEKGIFTDSKIETHKCYIDFFEYDNINIDIYKTYVKYILNNPKIAFENIDEFEKNRTNKRIYDDTSYINFINYHIHYIYENISIRNNLLKYFCTKYYYLTEPYQITDLLIGTIGILLNMCSYNGNNKFILFKPKISKEKIYNKLNKIKQDTKTIDKFLDYIIANKDSILFIPTDYKLIQKYFNGEIINDKTNYFQHINMFTINNSEFYILNQITKLNKLFNNNLDSLFLCEICYIQSELKYIKLHMLTEDFILSFDMDLILVDNYTKFIIKDTSKIYFNGKETIKFSEIIEPFKYVMPLCGIYLIYMQNNIYHITYFNSHNLSENRGDDKILGKNTIDKTIITVKINNNNMLYFERGNDEDIKLICENYGVNDYNYIYLGINNHTEYESEAAYYITKRLSKKYNNNFFIEKITNFRELAKYKVLENDNEDNIIELNKTHDIYNKKINEYREINKIALQKLINKIQNCTINKDESKYPKYEQKLKELIKYYNNIIKKYAVTISDFSLSTLFVDRFIHTVNRYLSAVRYKNICNTLLTTKKDNLCSIIKIYHEQFNNRTYHFNYIFEIFFELIFGFEITDEQYDRYTSIINKYNSSIGGKIYEKRKKTGKDEYYENELQELTKINEKQESDKEKQEFIIEKQQNFYKYLVGYKQVGGNKNYPLHHFMMGKGKSSVITPLLILYFSLIHKKEIYIIVPEHLIKQTENTLMTYINIFNLNNIYILSDSDIKKKFLDGEFTKNNENKIMLIDEIDSILDPLKSNFNLVKEKTKDINNIYEIILYIVKEISKGIKIDNIDMTNIKKHNTIKEFIKKDIKSILQQIETNKLKENINWGISHITCCAIPYLNKDKPLLKSNFSSCTLTILLTLYYYIIIKKYQLDEKLYLYINTNNYIYNIFNSSVIAEYNTLEKINEYLLKPDTNFDEIFHKIFNIILKSVLLSKEQYNTSFIDIINIDNIFKIGYSGTLNMEIPPINNLFENITADIDESANIRYAIENSNLVEFENIIYNDNTSELIKLFITESNLKKYGALIDACGIFKNVDNYDVAIKIHNELKKPVIYLDKIDNKLIINDGKIYNYDESVEYKEQPFMYYSQTHIIGIDINQNKYPNILGLCTVDDNTEYTTIAQAIFRLRKINMGHSVNFYIVNNKKIKLINPIKLYDMLIKNEKQAIKDKHNLLYFQTLKSLIRKNKPQQIPFENNYKEQIKYYFDDIINNNPKELLNGIIQYDDAIENPKIFDEIKHPDILIKLIYNINNISHEIVEIKEQEKKIETQIENKIEINIETVNLRSEISTALTRYMYITKEYDFNNFETHYKEKTIEINKFISIMPNIFNYFDGTNLYTNHVPSLIFIYLKEDNKLILIKKNDYMYVYDKFPIFNLQLILLNREMEINVDYSKINEFKRLDFIQILSRDNNYRNIQIDKLTDCEIVILCINLHSLYNITKVENELINLLKYKFIDTLFYDAFHEKIMDKHNPMNMLQKNPKYNSINIKSIENENIDTSLKGGYKLINKNYKKNMRYFKIKNI